MPQLAPIPPSFRPRVTTNPRRPVAWTVEALRSLALTIVARRRLLSFRRLEEAFELEDGPIPRKLAT